MPSPTSTSSVPLRSVRRAMTRRMLTPEPEERMWEKAADEKDEEGAMSDAFPGLSEGEYNNRPLVSPLLSVGALSSNLPRSVPSSHSLSPAQPAEASAGITAGSTVGSADVAQRNIDVDALPCGTASPWTGEWRRHSRAASSSRAQLEDDIQVPVDGPSRPPLKTAHSPSPFLFTELPSTPQPVDPDHLPVSLDSARAENRSPTRRTRTFIPRSPSSPRKTSTAHTTYRLIPVSVPPASSSCSFEPAERPPAVKWTKSPGKSKLCEIRVVDEAELFAKMGIPGFPAPADRKAESSRSTRAGTVDPSESEGAGRGGEKENTPVPELGRGKRKRTKAQQ